MKGGLAHALKTELTEEDRERLTAFMAELPDIEPIPKEQVNDG
jgi:hypothetical protein